MKNGFRFDVGPARNRPAKVDSRQGVIAESSQNPTLRGSASLYVLRIAKAELGATIGHDEEIEFGLWAGGGRAQRCISGEPVARIGGRSRGTVMPRVWRSINIAS